jgi:hypothetical protein
MEYAAFIAVLIAVYSLGIYKGKQIAISLIKYDCGDPNCILCCHTRNKDKLGGTDGTRKESY